MLFSVFVSTAAWANCTGPSGVEGVIMYNTDQHVFQYCGGSNWVLMAGGGGACGPSAGPVGCPNVGDECADGTVYAGQLSGVDLFTTHCDAGMSWNGSSCINSRTTMPWNNGSNTNYVNTPETNCDAPYTCDPDGQANTAILVVTDSDSSTAGVQPHQAAQYCADATDNGYADWYMPSSIELNVLFQNNAAIGNFDTTGNYYGSSSSRDTSRAWTQRFNDGLQKNGNGGTNFKYGHSSSAASGAGNSLSI